MQYKDIGIVLHSQPLQENGWILSIFGEENGKRKGVYKKKSPSLLGSIVHYTWNARLIEQLGFFQIEVIDIPVLKSLMTKPEVLFLFQSACYITDKVLAEGHPYPELYRKLVNFLHSLQDFQAGVQNYIFYELALLQYLGFGLDLSKCGAMGTREELIYVSPKTGRAICKAAGHSYHDKLLILPLFLISKTSPSLQELLEGLKLTGHFLQKHLLKELPSFRSLVYEKLQRQLLKTVVLTA